MKSWLKAINGISLYGAFGRWGGLHVSGNSAVWRLTLGWVSLGFIWRDLDRYLVGLFNTLKAQQQELDQWRTDTTPLGSYDAIDRARQLANTLQFAGCYPGATRVQNALQRVEEACIEYQMAITEHDDLRATLRDRREAEERQRQLEQAQWKAESARREAEEAEAKLKQLQSEAGSELA